MIFLQILADNTPITEPDMTRVGNSLRAGKGHGTGAGYKLAALVTQRAQLLNDSNLPVYSSQCQGNIACDSGSKSNIKWSFSTEKSKLVLLTLKITEFISVLD